MGLLSRLASALWGKSTPEQWWADFGATGRSNSGIVINQTTAMRITTVMACVRVRSEDIAKLPLEVFRKRSDGGRDLATDHFLYRLFRKPNAWQTWFEFCEMLQTGLLLRGNAYAVVIRDSRGVPKQMIPVNPDRVSVYEAPDGAVFYQVTRQGQHDVAVLKAFPMLISSDDVFHLRWISNNGLVGISPIGYCREAIGLAAGMEMHAANLIGAGARPSGVLQTDKKLQQETSERLATSWRNLHSGPANSGKTAILEEGLKWSPMTMNSVDLEFIAGRKHQLEEICRIFRVAPFKVGITEGVRGANIEQIQLQHYTDTIHPDCVRWEQKIADYFELPEEIFCEFDTTQLIRADLAARVGAARVGVMSGFFTPDDARISFGENPQGGAAGQLYFPSNMATLERVAAGLASGPGIGSDQSAAPADGGSGDAVQPPAAPDDIPEG